MINWIITLLIIFTPTVVFAAEGDLGILIVFILFPILVGILLIIILAMAASQKKSEWRSGKSSKYEHKKDHDDDVTFGP